jgi:ATP-dependent Lon protease
MLYGHSLPWQTALRRASCSSARYAYPPAFASIAPCRFTISPVTRYRLRPTHPPASICASRTFTTSLSLRKEKDPKQGQGLEDAEPKEGPEEDESKEPHKQGGSEELDSKLKTPEPIPQPKAGEARGSSSNGADNSSGDGGSKRRKSSDRSLVKPTIPEVYPQVMAIPIGKRPLFPGFYKAITIRNKEVGQAIADMVKRGQPYLGAFLLKDDDVDKDVIDNPSDVYDVGTFCQVTSAFPVGPDDNFAMTCVLYPHRRIKMTGLLPPSPPEPDVEPTNTDDSSMLEVATGETPIKEQEAAEESKGDVVASFEESFSEPETQPQYYDATAFLKGRKVSIANVENLVEEPFDRKKNPAIPALVSEIVNTFKEVALLNPLFRDQISTFSVQTTTNVGDDPVKLADFAAAVAQADSHELQEALEALNIEDRLSKALLVLKKELMNAKLQSKIVKEVESKIQKKQREYWLMEQMKGIKRELGIESDGKDKLIEKFKEKASKLAMPEAVKKVFEEEISKLAHPVTLGPKKRREFWYPARAQGLRRGSLRSQRCKGPHPGVYRSR